MAPKNKGKKGKRGGADDDDFWEHKAAEVEQKNAQLAQEDKEDAGGASNAFDLLDDDDEDGGGLMGTINKASKKDKKKNKKKNRFLDEDDMPAENGDVDGDSTPAADTAVNIDDEWPEEDIKPKKGKKGKKGGKSTPAPAEQDDGELEPEKIQEDVKPQSAKTEAAEEKEEAPDAGSDGDDDAGGGTKILTKKEKEKLKKEKERAKKKAQAAAKKSTSAAAPFGPSAPAQAADTPSAAPAAPGKAAKGKKVPAHIAAMQAAMLEKQRIEEEARKAEEERQKRIEEEEARIAAEEQRLAEQKAAKKQKEKEKQARLKAEGKILTPAQKREREIAEARKQAMLASGMTVAGLQGGVPEKKKPVYGKKKGKGPAQAKEEPKAKEPAKPADLEPATEQPKAEPVPAAAEDDEDDWEKEDEPAAKVDEVTNGVQAVKINDVDDWDASSDDEPEPEPTPAPTAKTTGTPAAKTSAPSTQAKGAAPQQISKAAPPTPNGKAVDEEESSSEEEDSSDEDSDSDMDSEEEFEMKKEQALERVMERRRKAEEVRLTSQELRSPITVMLGHVDHGKTRLLDAIRQTSVAAGEAGGITQAIGSSFLPQETLVAKTARVNTDNFEIKTGLLALDTPGHASFSNLRARGSSLCDVAILVVDITQGFEPTTLESLELLRKSRTPFAVALNKIDRMYGWKSIPGAGFRETYDTQPKHTQQEFIDRLRRVKLTFSEHGLNSELYDENTQPGRTVSLVPTSGMTGEGLPDLLLLLSRLAQDRLTDRLRFSPEPDVTVLDVKVVEGMGTTLDLVLRNGLLKRDSKFVICGTDGPIVSHIRGLLTPPPLRDLRIKTQYVHHDEVRASLGIKLFAPGLEKAIAGGSLLVCQDEDDEMEVEALKDLVMQDITNLQRFASGNKAGVFVSASSLGSLEALLSFLQEQKVPVRDFGIGPIRRQAIRKASLMVDSHPEYAMILAFDVPIEKDAADMAAKEGVTIFREDVIYTLMDKFTAHMTAFNESKKQAALPNAVWPVRLQILKVFAARDPIVLGVEIKEGTLRVGTPLGVMKGKEVMSLGKVTSIEINHKPVDKPVRRQDIGAGAAIKVEHAPHEPSRMAGRHFSEADEIISVLSRKSIDTLKASFRDQVTKDEWLLIKQMKVEQQIP